MYHFRGVWKGAKRTQLGGHIVAKDDRINGFRCSA
jgi:hypothetical protein